MKLQLEPVQFPEHDLHVLFRLNLAGQDPLPVVHRFLHRALREGVVDDAVVVGRMITPLGHAAILDDGRLRAFVFVEWDRKTYGTPYTIFPSRSKLQHWFRLAREMGDARLMGTRAADAEEGAGRDGGTWADPRGIRWCPACEGLNAPTASRCIWCRRSLPEGERGAPAASTPAPVPPKDGWLAP